VQEKIRRMKTLVSRATREAASRAAERLTDWATDRAVDGSRRHHVVITGTGRAGTTFLIQLLTYLGLDTGYDVSSLTVYEHARAGLEHDLRRDDAPYIVKDPWFCDYAADILPRNDVVIDRVFIPMRDLHAASESRRLVTANTPVDPQAPDAGVPGGLWHTTDGAEQETVLLGQIYKLLLALSDVSVPVSLLRFPRIVKDGPYLFDKLAPILRGMGRDRFLQAFARTVRHDLVHSFNENDR
jgi:hypothetical protein